MSTQVSANQEFIKKLDILKKKFSISYTAAGRKIGVNSDKIKSIRLGRSSADNEMLNDLIDSFPELKDEIGSNGEYAPKDEVEEHFEDIEKKIAALEAENREQRRLIYKLLEKADIEFKEK